ncbi:hypothetical protein NPIL_245961 [Nephila pilipes]|uniref:Uncharacterized protein n=1 Tax=Nephila pilipes TaxID=299642 RepID=A0A8X6II67_NEPPI|nr:hypothetical protein NPIL_245961 [Nephila pilipes]
MRPTSVRRGMTLDAPGELKVAGAYQSQTRLGATDSDGWFCSLIPNEFQQWIKQGFVTRGYKRMDSDTEVDREEKSFDET